MTTKKTKNKNFIKWTRAESCFRKDAIVSTDWHERLERLPVFTPSYARTQPNMVYLMSMEYARIWQKEKEEWFSQIFQAQPKQQDILNRRKKIRKEMQEQKRQAAIKIQEWKEKVAREKEAKAKAEAEAQEKARRIKAKLERCVNTRKTKAPKRKKAFVEHQIDKGPKATDTCPKGWQQVELTMQCECGGSQKQNSQEEGKKDGNESKVEKELEKKPEDTCGATCLAEQVAGAVGMNLKKEETGATN